MQVLPLRSVRLSDLSGDGYDWLTNFLACQLTGGLWGTYMMQDELNQSTMDSHS